jgi:hypothetical protein
MRFHHWDIVSGGLRKALHAGRRILELRSNTKATPPGTVLELPEPQHSPVKLTLIVNKHYRDAGSHKPSNVADAALNKAGASECMTATDYIWSAGTFV